MSEPARPDVMAVAIVDRESSYGSRLHLARPGHMRAICGTERYSNADVVEPDAREALRFFQRGVAPGWITVTNELCMACSERAREGTAI